MKLLPTDFQPTEKDVILGRGSRVFSHPGNERFRNVVVASKLASYQAATSKVEKSFIIGRIVAQIRAESPTGGFVKKDLKTDQWYEVGTFLAKEKVSQCFRDLLDSTNQYKSSNGNKRRRRRAEQLMHAKIIRSASPSEENKNKIGVRLPSATSILDDPFAGSRSPSPQQNAVWSSSCTVATTEEWYDPTKSELRSSSNSINDADRNPQTDAEIFDRLAELARQVPMDGNLFEPNPLDAVAAC